MAYQSTHDGPEVDDAVGVVKGGANGFIVKTGTGASARRTLLGTAGQIAVANGDGTGGNPTASLDAAAVASLARADGALLKSGAEPMAGALPMGSNKITGLAEGTNPNDAVRVSQLPDAVDEARLINTGTGLVGGGDLSADRTIAADIASEAEAETGTDNTKLMTSLRVAQSVTENAPAPAQLSEAQAADPDSTVFGTVSGERLAAAVDEAFNVTGATPKYAARTWVNFDGTTTPPTIRASGNILSVARDATGTYTCTLIEDMPDANYAVASSGHATETATGAGRVFEPFDYKVGSFRIVSAASSSGSSANSAIISAVIVR